VRLGAQKLESPKIDCHFHNFFDRSSISEQSHKAKPFAMLSSLILILVNVEIRSGNPFVKEKIYLFEVVAPIFRVRSKLFVLSSALVNAKLNFFL
jgi:hypothetical protein